MKVRILKKNKLVKGRPGEEVECAADKGNLAAGTGFVKIVQHESVIPSQPKAVVLDDEAGLRAKREQEGAE